MAAVFSILGLQNHGVLSYHTLSLWILTRLIRLIWLMSWWWHWFQPGDIISAHHPCPPSTPLLTSTYIPRCIDIQVKDSPDSPITHVITRHRWSCCTWFVHWACFTWYHPCSHREFLKGIGTCHGMAAEANTSAPKGAVRIVLLCSRRVLTMLWPQDGMVSEPW